MSFSTIQNLPTQSQVNRLTRNWEKCGARKKAGVIAGSLGGAALSAGGSLGIVHALAMGFTGFATIASSALCAIAGIALILGVAGATYAAFTLCKTPKEALVDRHISREEAPKIGLGTKIRDLFSTAAPYALGAIGAIAGAGILSLYRG